MITTSSNLGRRTFLAVESLFNLIFGERLNPFYYLGAIAYFLFWVVAGTGLYLYAFFETSVVHAYVSVQALTHGQAYAGGLLRSLHRYASDALVLVIVLHLVRHFVFDRHRGYRWFSWISGVVILWLTYASGINGYMLPWDRLAQFVVTATTEWFDALPVIGGSMTRNFISNANVGDRLFSLLSFVHIGLPLSVLALLWVHTQRVPGARTSPPRALMIGLMVSLTLLSLLKPALSQSMADMGTVVPLLEFDWFLLPTYALIQRWGPNNTWLLVLGATALLLVLPWLPPRRSSGLPSWSMAVHPDDRIVTLRAGETLLDAGLREGLPMPFECRNGACGVCKCTIKHGTVKLLAHLESALSAAQQTSGQTLLCCAEPLSDVEISYVAAVGARAAPVKHHVARVTRLELLSSDVMRLDLQLDDGTPLAFHAGQYINVILSDGARRSFSFANAPHAGSAIELHVRRVAGGRFTPGVFTTLSVGDSLRIEGPLGAFTLREDSSKPILFVAGSTGFAPVKSMLEHAFHTGLRRQIVLYWGVRSRADLYLGELAEQWAREHANFRFVPVLSAQQPDDAWSGRTGLVHEVILADYPDLSAHQVYACGSVQMVQAAQPAFAERGLSSDDCFSDAFHLAPQRPVQGQDAELVKLGGSHV